MEILLGLLANEFDCKPTIQTKKNITGMHQIIALVTETGLRKKECSATKEGTVNQHVCQGLTSVMHYHNLEMIKKMRTQEKPQGTCA